MKGCEAMATMYELTADYMNVLQLATDPDIDPQTIADTLETIGGEIEEKADAYAKILKELDAECEKLKAEETRLNARRKSVERNAADMKKRLQDAMTATGKTKFKTNLFSFSIGKNPVKLVIDDESKIPKKYLIPQPAKLDAAKLKEDLKAGAIRKYAHLEQTESLRIK